MLNCIVINANKSNFLSFNVTDIVANLAGKTLENLHVIKYLGIFINDKLTWSKQVDVVVNNCCQRIGLFKKVLTYFTNDIALLYYNAFIRSCFFIAYCVGLTIIALADTN